MDDTFEKVRQRAYDLWVEAGQPEGRHEEHWAQASRELGGEPTEDDRLDAGLEESFPSSDPVSEAQPGGGITGPGAAK
jgi:hypothetical protein